MIEAENEIVLFGGERSYCMLGESNRTLKWVSPRQMLPRSMVKYRPCVVSTRWQRPGRAERRHVLRFAWIDDVLH